MDTRPAAEPRDALDRLLAAADDGRLATLAARHGLTLLVAFGSTVADVDDPHDLDLAFEAAAGLDRLALHDDLAELAGLNDLDLMNLARAGLIASAEALGTARLLYEREDGTFADRQMVVLTRTMDSRWLRELDLDVLASR